MKKLLILLLLVFNFLLTTNSVFAGEAKPMAEDPVLEARLKAMSHELRCLVCQNQTLADSNSPLAEDLRKEIRTQMRAGKSDQEENEYMVGRYADFVRSIPGINSNTELL